MIDAIDYQNSITKNRVKENPLHLGEKDIDFGQYQKIDVGDGGAPADYQSNPHYL